MSREAIISEPRENELRLAAGLTYKTQPSPKAEPAEHLAWWQERFAEPDTHIELAYLGGLCVGVVMATATECGPQLDVLVVADRHRNKSIGRSLLEKLGLDMSALASDQQTTDVAS